MDNAAGAGGVCTPELRIFSFSKDDGICCCLRGRWALLYPIFYFSTHIGCYTDACMLNVYPTWLY